MPTGLPLDALGFALLAAAAFACLDLAQKWSARYAVATPAGFLALRLLAGAALSPLLFLLPGAWTGRQPPWPLFAAFVVVQLAGNALYLWSIYGADISTLSSLWPLKNLYLPLLAWFLPPFERYHAAVYGLSLLATAGAVGVAWDGERGARALLLRRPVWLMALVTVPVFALSDKLFGGVSFAVGGAAATAYGAWALAALACPFLLADRGTRGAVAAGLRTGRGTLGAALTGLFLVLGVACIGEAFRRAGGQVVLVNVFAMLSGVLIVAVNAAAPGWLEREPRRVYAVRFAGAVVLCAAATLVFAAAR